MNQQEMRNQVRDKVMAIIVEALTTEYGEENIPRTSANTIAVPEILNDGNECFAKITISIPTGSRDGTAYDAFEEAKEYEYEVEQKAEKKRAKEAEALRKKEEQAKRKAEAKAKKALKKMLKTASEVEEIESNDDDVIECSEE